MALASRLRAAWRFAALLLVVGQRGPAAWAQQPASGRRPILITVDDLPIAAGSVHPEPDDRAAITRGLLAALQKHRIQAVGLVAWGKVSRPGDRELLTQWLRAGHELGNHSHSHLDYTHTPAETYVADVERGRAALAELLFADGKTLRFFRYPFLCEGDTESKLDTMRAYLERTGQRNLPVSIDNQDWSFEEPWVKAAAAGDGAALEEITQDYVAALRIAVRHHESRGDHLAGRTLPQILLLHAGAVGAAHWDSLFTWLERTGHRFASADEVLADSVFARPCRYVGDFGCGLWDRLAHQRGEIQARAEVETLLRQQAAAWSRGDLDAFCAVYAPDALFLSPSGTTRGRQAVLERYRARYPGKEAMGALTLELLELRTASGTEFTLLGDAVPSRIHGASAAARWTLSYPDRPTASGLTLLVLHRRDDGWEIVQDSSM
jgi:uncharacterized protein (TIGR02246 family)